MVIHPRNMDTILLSCRTLGERTPGEQEGTRPDVWLALFWDSGHGTRRRGIDNGNRCYRITRKDVYETESKYRVCSS